MSKAHHQIRRRGSKDESRRAWKRLDNASNIFIATMTDLDTKVFRIGADLDHDIDPTILQDALDRTYDRYPLYHSVMRRGFFWYYLEESDLRPVVRPDKLVPFEHLYHLDRRDLLFRVVHHGRRVSLEVFHALSDGTGGWWFFQDLVTEYLRLRSGDVREPIAPTAETSLGDDSFVAHFGERSGRSTQFGQDSSAGKNPLFGSKGPRVARVRGTITPDRRNRLIELTVPADEVVRRAKAAGSSVTIHLIAMYFEAARRILRDENPHIAITVPVNLRTYFPSETTRNFFSVTRLEHTYGIGDDSIEAVAGSLKAQLMPQLSKESLQARSDALLDMQRHPIARFVPRVVKDAILSVVNSINERALTLGMTGLGKLELADDVDEQVGALHLSVSSRRPQMSILTHRNWMTLGFTSPFVETDLVEAFVDLLREEGIPVTASVTKVTEAELEGARR